jgi:predicted AAA+ superfamily ATPase
MRSYSRFIASDGKLINIRADIASNEVDTLNEETIALYINLLRKIFVVEEMPAWSPNLRSKSTIRTTDTRHFVHLRNGSYGLVEIKLGNRDIDEAAKNLTNRDNTYPTL